LAFNKAAILQTHMEAGELRLKPAGPFAMQEADHRHRLLRPRHYRPSDRRTTNQRDELAPPHVRPLAQEVTSYRLKPALWKGSADVRFGSIADIVAVRWMSALPPKADMNQRALNVCFLPLADITALIGDARYCPESRHS
jgi:hypothetical protein